MSFHDERPSSVFRFGSAAGHGFATIVNESGSGHEFRIGREAQGRHRFRLLKQTITTDEAMALKVFAAGRRSMLHSWPLQDFLDYSTAADHQGTPSATDQILGTGDGSTVLFQLVKRYETTGPNEYPRVLQLPVAGSVVVAVNGTPTGAFTVNSVGQVLLTTPAPLGQLVTAGCLFEVPVRFLNDLQMVQADAFGRWSVADFDAIEVKNEVEYPERWFAGGATASSPTASVQLALKDGFLQHFTPSTAISAFLPNPARMPGGDRFLCISVATGAAGSVQLRDDAGNTVGAAITAGQVKHVGLVVVGTTSTWVVF